MPEERPLPEDLKVAASTLEKRFRATKYKFRKINFAEWESLPVRINALIPQSLKLLLSEFALTSERRDYSPNIFTKNESDPELDRDFAFETIPYLQSIIRLDDTIILGREVLNRGYVPFAEAGDGSLWLLKQGDDPMMPVWVFDLSGMEVIDYSASMALFLKNLEFGE